jgi:formylglycine-generating enzyme required for sulfatase activity
VIFDSANYRVQPFLEQYPVAGVTWYGARAYCNAIGRRLPTEAEWERAARGSDGRIFPWGNEYSGDFAKTSRPIVEENLRGAVQVGSYPLGRSPYGVFDMAGNVEEWVNDWYSETYYRQPESSGPNPQGPPAGTQKVLRGGSWATMPFFARTPHRRSLEPDRQSISAGFRCADDAPTPGVDTGLPVVPAAPAGSGAQTAPETFDSAPTLPALPTTSAPPVQQTLPPLPPGG